MTLPERENEQVITPEKPPSPLDIVPTGIEGFDDIIGGGFIKGRTYLVAGETGTGKTLFSLNYLVYGATIGEPGIYLLVDEDYEDFVKGALSFGWDLEALIKKNLLSILTLLPDFAEKMRDKPIETIVKSLVYNLKGEAMRIGAKRLVIDPVAPLVMGEKDLTWTRSYVRNLVISIEKELGTTSIITSEIPTGSNALSRFGVEEFLAAGVFVLGIERIKGEFIRTLHIRKMRWRPVKPALYQFSIELGRGIVVNGKIKI